MHGILVGTLTYPAPWTNLVLSFFWIGLVLPGVGMMFSGNFRKHAKSYPNEPILCGLYLFAIFSYDYLVSARSNFIRFCIPSLPFVFFGDGRTRTPKTMTRIVARDSIQSAWHHVASYWKNTC